MTNTVRKFVLVFRLPGLDGWKLAQHQQGRYTYDTPGHAWKAMRGLFTNNTTQELVDFYGSSSPYDFAIAVVDCYPGHFDPVSSRFASPDILATAALLPELHHLA